MGPIPRDSHKYVLARRPELTVRRKEKDHQEFLRQIRRLRDRGIHLQASNGRLRTLLPFLSEDSVDALLVAAQAQNVRLLIRIDIEAVVFDEALFAETMQTIFEMTTQHQKGLEKITGEPLTFAVFLSGYAQSKPQDVGPKSQARVVRIPQGQTAASWLRTARLQKEVQALRAQSAASAVALREADARLAALTELTEALALGGSVEETEQIFVEGLVKHIGATLVKVYTVDDEGVVFADKAYQLNHGEIEVLTGEDNPSHFKGGRTPQQYQSEMMGTIMRVDESILIEPNPAANPQCQGFDSEPFVSIREERGGKPRRIYIIEVADAGKINRRTPTFDFISSTHELVAGAKERLWESAVDQAIRDIEAAVNNCRSSRKVVDAALEHLPALFEVSGCQVSQILAVRITGKNEEELRRVAEAFPSGLGSVKEGGSLPKEIEGKPTLSSLVTGQGRSLRLTSTAGFEAIQEGEEGVKLSGKGEGSFLGAPIVSEGPSLEQEILGAITVTSPLRNAFTPQQEVVLARIGKIMGKAITDLQRLERRIQRDKDFPTAYSGAYVAEEILPGLIAKSQATGKKLSAAFFDLDWFKACNSAFGWTIVDKHILGPTVELLANLIRDLDYLARFGGDEFYLLFPETDREDVRLACERLLRAIRDNELVFRVTPGEIDKSLARTAKRLLNKLTQGLRGLLSPLNLRRRIIQFLSQQKDFLLADKHLRAAMIKIEEIKYEFRHATTLDSVKLARAEDGSYIRTKDGEYVLEVKMRLSASIGATEHKGEEGEDLIRRASEAAAVAKRTKGCVVVR